MWAELATDPGGPDWPNEDFAAVAPGAAAGQLARHHEDPFDRMLIAQANAEGLTILTRDKRFNEYSVALLPA